MESIFIQIPAYRDYELWNTVADAATKASGRYKLVFGIHNCLLEKDKENFPDIPDLAEYAEIRHIESIAPKNIGLQLARMKANETYGGETYYFQTDSHMRFDADWDEGFVKDIAYYQDFGATKPLLTSYPPNYQYSEDRSTINFDDLGAPTQICFHQNEQQFRETLIPSQTAIHGKENCGYTNSVSGGMIFTLGEFNKITPNPKIAFWGEEPLIAARAFTNGFDLFMPTHNRVWHLYAMGNTFEKTRRHHAWMDFPEIWATADKQSKAEFETIFTKNIVGIHELGSERTLAEYEEFCGLNFSQRKVVGERGCPCNGKWSQK